MKTIMIIDDDVNIGNMLEEKLKRQGYSVIRAYSGTEAMLLLDKSKPDLVLLDLMLPGISGEELLPKIDKVPVIVVSAKIDMDNKVDLLRNGACDYVTKPFDMKELLARIEIWLKVKNFDDDKTMLYYKDIALDTERMTAIIGETEIRLTRTENAILKMLMINHDKVVTKSSILDCISMDTPDCTESSLKMHVSNLRKKLKKVNNKDYIEAVWGIGFKIKSE